MYQSSSLHAKWDGLRKYIIRQDCVQLVGYLLTLKRVRFTRKAYLCVVFRSLSDSHIRHV